MKNTLETKLGIFVVLAIFAALFVLEMVGGFDFWHGGRHVSAQFANIQDLKVGDPVKMAGVVVGRVDKIEITDAKVKVTLRLDSKAAVKTDSTATIRFVGLMGQNYVAVDFGTPNAGLAEENTVILSAEQPDLNSLMAKLDNAAAGVENLTKSFTPDSINNLLGPITDFVKQNSENLGVSIANLKDISGQISSGQGTVGRLIYSNDFYNAALVTVTNLQDVAANAQVILNDVSAGKGSLGKLVKDETLYVETASMMTNLHQVMLKINSGQGTVGKLINDQEFYKNAKLSLQKLDKAADSLEDSGPMSVLGQAVGTLF